MLANVEILAVGAALASVVAAGQVAGRVIVNNDCTYDVSVWAVGGTQSPVTYVRPGESFSEELHRDPVSGGRDIKITKRPGQLSGPHLQLAYNAAPDGNNPADLNSGVLNYDLNAIFDSPFAGEKVTLQSTDCPHMIWATGRKPEGARGEACQGLNRDLNLTLCASGKPLGAAE